MGAAYMGWSHCREMLNYGISFQSHTCNHPDLTMLTDRDVLKELSESKGTIEDMLGTPANHLAYPFGRYNSVIMQLAEQAGYMAAYAGGISSRHKYCMERCEVIESDGMFLFALKSSPWVSWIRSVYNLILRS
jgi:hypothetical protein